ncbi:MAG: NDP-sugar synthase [Elusimicrobia bacterium]|nr:NDP-sugar synthase [Candidatus Liberimonas magnetica]
MKALILIGGLGTRLRPLTCFTPKPLLPIVNVPFLEYQFKLLKQHMIKEIVLCIAYLPDEFKRHFGTGKKWGLKIHYVHEDHPLGTGGAVRNADKHINEPIVVFNGDMFTDINLTKMYEYHKKKKAYVTLALTRVKDPTLFGLVETDKNGRIERFLEKPFWDEITCNTINAGTYIFEPEAIKHIPEAVNYSLERGLFPNLLNKKYNLYGYIFNGYWLDIGTIDKYLQAHHDMISGKMQFNLPGHRVFNNVWAGKKLQWGKNIDLNGRLVCGENVRIGDFVQIVGNVCLGDNISLGKGCYINDSVVMDNTKIGEGVRIETALIGKKCCIEANSVLSSMVTLGDNSVIQKYSRL